MNVHLRFRCLFNMPFLLPPPTPTVPLHVFMQMHAIKVSLRFPRIATCQRWENKEINRVISPFPYGVKTKQDRDGNCGFSALMPVPSFSCAYIHDCMLTGAWCKLSRFPEKNWPTKMWTECNILWHYFHFTSTRKNIPIEMSLLAVHQVEATVFVCEQKPYPVKCEH